MSENLHVGGLISKLHDEPKRARKTKEFCTPLAQDVAAPALLTWNVEFNRLRKAGYRRLGSTRLDELKRAPTPPAGTGPAEPFVAGPPPLRPRSSGAVVPLRFCPPRAEPYRPRAWQPDQYVCRLLSSLPKLLSSSRQQPRKNWGEVQPGFERCGWVACLAFEWHRGPDPDVNHLQAPRRSETIDKRSRCAVRDLRAATRGKYACHQAPWCRPRSHMRYCRKTLLQDDEYCLS